MSSPECDFCAGEDRAFAANGIARYRGENRGSAVPPASRHLTAVVEAASRYDRLAAMVVI